MKTLEIMKAITLWNPWAMFVPWLEKGPETRSWYTPYRGPLAIHAAVNMPSWVKKLCQEEPFKSTLEKHGVFDLKSLPSGCVVAVCNLFDIQKIVSESRRGRCATLENGGMIFNNEYLFGDYTPGRFAWILKDIKPLPEPIPAKGAQRIWNWEVPSGIAI